MADLPIQQHRNYPVEATEEVKQLWIEAKKQELKSRKSRLAQDIEDLLEGRVKTLKAEILMCEEELKKLEVIEVQ